MTFTVNQGFQLEFIAIFIQYHNIVVCSKNHQRALDTIQISLEAEARGRLEALRQRKKLEQDVLELEAALEATVRARGDVEKNYKRFQQQIRDLELVVEEEQAATQVRRAVIVVVVVVVVVVTSSSS